MQRSTTPVPLAAVDLRLHEGGIRLIFTAQGVLLSGCHGDGAREQAANGLSARCRRPGNLFSGRGGPRVPRAVVRSGGIHRVTMPARCARRRQMEAHHARRGGPCSPDCPRLPRRRRVPLAREAVVAGVHQQHDRCGRQRHTRTAGCRALAGSLHAVRLPAAGEAAAAHGRRRRHHALLAGWRGQHARSAAQDALPSRQATALQQMCAVMPNRVRLRSMPLAMFGLLCLLRDEALRGQSMIAVVLTIGNERSRARRGGRGQRAVCAEDRPRLPAQSLRSTRRPATTARGQILCSQSANSGARPDGSRHAIAVLAKTWLPFRHVGMRLSQAGGRVNSLACAA